MRVFVLAASLLCLACIAGTPSAGEVTDRADIQGYKLTIGAEKKACRLNYHGPSGSGQVEISPKPPCYFLRRESGQPQSFSYSDVGVEAVLIAVGTPIKDETRKTWNLSTDLVCGQELQGILVKKKQVTLSKSILREGVWCKDKGADEKDFWFFAHEKG